VQRGISIELPSPILKESTSTGFPAVWDQSTEIEAERVQVLIGIVVREFLIALAVIVKDV